MPREKSGRLIVVIVVGGGNIGSHLTPHLARMPAIDRVVLIDRDTYEERNLTSQDITPDDVGKPKAIVQAKRLQAIRPSVVVEAVCGDVTALPLGALSGDVILACLDNNATRQFVGEAAWHLGVPLIDAGVRNEGLLVRTCVYVPGPEAPCMQCGWDTQQYLALEQEYPCNGADAAVPPTRSPSFLGSLAASLQAIECAKLLEGNLDRAAVGKQILINADSHKHYVTRLPFNDRCRFDHRVWEIEQLDQDPGQITLGEALDLGGKGSTENTRLAFSFRPKVFFRKRFSCPGCLFVTERVGLREALPAHSVCERCGERTEEEIVGVAPELDGSALAPSLLGHSMVSIGFRPGDVFTVMGPDRARRFEISGNRA
jgi:molybdopterin/thiamine biosynthesis adenylyltransferase